MSLPGLRPRSPPGPRRRSISPHDRERQAFRSGLLVSAVAHILFIAIYPFLFDGGEVRPPTGDPTPPLTLVPGTEIVDLVELTEPEEPPDEPQAPEIEEEVAIEPQAVQPVADGADTPPDTDGDEDEEELTVAERLQPRIVDPRVWAPMNPAYFELTDHERAELLLRGMIESWNDSMAVAEALSERAMDWTYTDDEGRRWGLSPGRLHLGDFSIPLPFSLALPPGRREALNARQLIRDDLARGAATAIIRETWAERARAIRERLEADRANPDGVRAGDDGGGGGDP